MGDKVRCRASFRDICNTTDKNDKKSVYFLFSTKRNRKRGRDFKRTISNKTPKKYIVGIMKLCFIYNEYEESDSNAYNCGGFYKIQ